MHELFSHRERVITQQPKRKKAQPKVQDHYCVYGQAPI